MKVCQKVCSFIFILSDRYFKRLDSLTKNVFKWTPT